VLPNIINQSTNAVKVLPQVGWAERGGGLATGHGNSVPRFHITWGTGPGVVEPFERRVREAQQLLMEATLTIAQVAERVGYEHQSSFAAAFKNQVGMSPREYRCHRAPFSLEFPA
jgi:predicted oxidoreductase